MADRLKIVSAQLNPVVGDGAGNLAKARAAHAEARARQADLVIFPEMFLMGYPPEDLVLKPAAVKACAEAMTELVRETRDDGPAVVKGGVRLAQLIARPARREARRPARARAVGGVVGGRLARDNLRAPLAELPPEAVRGEGAARCARRVVVDQVAVRGRRAASRVRRVDEGGVGR